MTAQASAVVTSTTPLWYATRATGVISLMLLSTSVVLGILLQTRAASERWPRLVVSGVHRNVSLLVCAFLALHIITAEADTFAPVGWWATVIPFASAYRPVWLGLGTVAADLLVALVVSSLLRTRISLRMWLLIHWTAYLCWPLAVIHGLGTGTDARSPAIALITLVCAGAVLVAVCGRLASDWRSHTATRAAAGAAGLASVAVTASWALTGPFAPGWSAKADTPARAGVAQASNASVVGLQLPVSAAVAGTVQTRSSSDGQHTVTLAGSVGPDVVRIAITGPPAPDGGVQMTSSQVTFGTSAAPDFYTGTVTALDGETVRALVTGPAGTATLTLTATISGARFTGTFQAVSGG